MPFIPTAQIAALVVGNVQGCRQNINDPQPRPVGGFLAQEIIQGGNVGGPTVVTHVVRTRQTEEIGVLSQPDEFSFDIPAIVIGCGEKESCSLIKKKVGYTPKSHGGSQPMGIQVRDERQMQAFTGLSQAQFDDLLPAFSDIYGATQRRH